jgi:NitT/TauT family transport system permease protein
MATQGIETPVEVATAAEATAPADSYAPQAVGAPAPTTPPAPTRRWRWRTVLAVPAAAGIALAVHHFIPDQHPPLVTRYYPTLLASLLALGVVAAIVQAFWDPLRRQMREKAPIFAAAILTVCAWEVITVKFFLIPLPYFPGPELIVNSLVSDRRLLFDATWHSLFLLMRGYLLGVAMGLVSGVSIGWSRNVRYWGMPLLKVVGPIPATALVPLAMVLFSGAGSAVALIAVAVWFPVTMLTASGVSNVRASLLDVARTLGARRAFLIFRVAIPAAMPSIFIGLFMGLGSSFLTLIVAEQVGVKSGLGWYISWAQGWAEYGKVFAALVIMSAFFSTIMTVLFKVRDRVLVWQKGVIKW